MAQSCWTQGPNLPSMQMKGTSRIQGGYFLGEGEGLQRGSRCQVISKAKAP